MNFWLLAAAIASAATLLIHFFIGGREIAAHLLKDDLLHPVVRMTSYFCWHLVTIMLAAMTVLLALPATGASPVILAQIGTAIAAASLLLNIGINLRFRLNWVHHIQWVLFGAVTGLAVPGLV